SRTNSHWPTLAAMRSHVLHEELEGHEGGAVGGRAWNVEESIPRLSTLDALLFFSCFVLFAIFVVIT
ncbi:MAG: hypothetical protein JJU36_05360, partial [Phycisphaeraceae bacterium]|nr:hypothetical protein [Phycisphaeraceae bacterium]